MPKSLRCKLSDLRYKRLITDEEYQEMIKKLDGHDREIRNKAIDDFVKLFMEEDSKHILDYNYYETIREIAKQLKGE